LKKKFHTKVLEFLTNALNSDTRLTWSASMEELSNSALKF